MREQEPKKAAKKPASKADDLLKTSKKSRTELTEEDAGRVSGGDYWKIKLDYNP